MATTTATSTAAQDKAGLLAIIQAGFGGGLTAAQVNAMTPAQLAAAVASLPQAPATSAANAIGSAADTVGSVISTASDTATGIANIANLVTSTSFWIRVGEGILGALLILLGLKAMTGTSLPAV